MEKLVTVTEANRTFSALVREVVNGQPVIITAHGRPIVRMESIEEEAVKRRLARARLLDRLENQKATGLERDWTRSDLYDDV